MDFTRTILSNLLGVFAIRETGAGKEFTETAEFYCHWFSTFITNLIGGFGERFFADFFIFHSEVFLEWCVKFFEYGDPVFFTFGDSVEVLFHVGGEVIVDNIGEMFDEQVVYFEGEFSWFEFACVFFNIATFNDSADGWGVG